MGVHTETIITTYYEIICDYCGKVEEVSNSRYYGGSICNRRNAVRSIGWVLQRNDKVMCSNCSCYQKYKK